MEMSFSHDDNEHRVSVSGGHPELPTLADPQRCPVCTMRFPSEHDVHRHQETVSRMEAKGVLRLHHRIILSNFWKRHFVGSQLSRVGSAATAVSNGE